MDRHGKPGIGYRHLQVFLMCLSITFFYIVRGSMSIAIIAMTDSTRGDEVSIQTFPWNKRIQGAVLSAFFWGYMIMQIPSGVIAKKYGGQPILLIALLINALLSLLAPVLVKYGDWRALCASRAGIGIAQGCLFPAVHTLLGRWIPEQERAWLSNVVYAGVQLGTIIALPICGMLADSFYGWVSIFYVVGIVGVITTILWWYLGSSSPVDHKQISKQERMYIEGSLNTNYDDMNNNHIPWAAFVTSGPVIALTITHTGINWTFVIFFVEIPGYMAHVLDINLSRSCWISCLPFLAMWINSLLCGWLSAYITNVNLVSLTASRKIFNSIASFGVALGLAILSFIPVDYKLLAVIVLTITVGIQASSFSGFLLNHIDLSPNYAGVLLGITNCISNTIGALAPLTTGLILGKEDIDPTRWKYVFFLAAFILSSTNVIFLLYGTSDRQHWDSPTTNNMTEDMELLISKRNKKNKT